MTSGNARRVDGVNASPMDNPLPPPSVPAIDRPAEVHGISSSKRPARGHRVEWCARCGSIGQFPSNVVDTEATTKLAVIRRQDE